MSNTDETQTHPTPPPPALDTFAAWYDHLGKELESAKKLRESLRELGRKGVHQASDEVLRGAARSLRRLKLHTRAHQEAADTLAGALTGEVERRIRTRREGLLDAIRSAAEDADISWKRVADDPLEITLGPFTARFDTDEKATLLLGREPVREHPADASIVAASQRLQEQMKDERIASDTFFDLLQRAWRMALLARGHSRDERVDLVDLLHPLGLLRSNPDTWRRQREGFAPMERWRVAYQLYRLRKEGALQQQGMRLELGAATLSTTKDTRNVLWIEEGGGRGQFYGSLRFVRSPQEGATDTSSQAETPGATATPSTDTAATQADLDALLDEIDNA